MFLNVLISKLMKKILSCDKSNNIVCGNVDELTSYISKCLTKISKEKKESYVTGDFNVDLLKYDGSNKHQKNLNMLTSSVFLPYKPTPTTPQVLLIIFMVITLNRRPLVGIYSSSFLIIWPNFYLSKRK